MKDPFYRSFSPQYFSVFSGISYPYITQNNLRILNGRNYSFEIIFTGWKSSGKKFWQWSPEHRFGFCYSLSFFGFVFLTDSSASYFSWYYQSLNWIDVIGSFSNDNPIISLRQALAVNKWITEFCMWRSSTQMSTTVIAKHLLDTVQRKCISNIWSLLRHSYQL